MITPAFSLTATERVLPKLALDFTTASLDSRVVVTRALNTATRINSSGLVEVINANLPRFDYNPSTLVCQGLLVEETRINIAPYSQAFGSWTPSSGTTVVDNFAISPDGTQNASRISGAAGAARNVRQVIAKSANSSTFSVWLKSNTGSNQSVRIWADTNAGLQSTKTVTTTWQRFDVTGTTTTSAQIQIDNTSGGGAIDILAWGAQFEVGSFATSYIPNLSTGTTTRNGDVVKMTGTDFSSWYNTSEGTFSVMADKLAINTTQSYLVSTDPSTGCPTMYSRNATAFIEAGLTNVFGFFNGTAISANTMFQTAYAYKQSSHALSVNASAVSTSSNSTAPAACTFFAIGSDGTSGQWNGHVAKVNYYPQRVINAQVQTFAK